MIVESGETMTRISMECIMEVVEVGIMIIHLLDYHQGVIRTFLPALIVTALLHLHVHTTMTVTAITDTMNDLMIDLTVDGVQAVVEEMKGMNTTRMNDEVEDGTVDRHPRGGEVLVTTKTTVEEEE